jgi:hypothetical protein
MIYESPRWLRVLCAWQSNPDRMAPTIPFVIGAMREPVGVSVTRHRSIEEEIRVPLESIRDEMPEAKHVLVKLCGTINEWVVYLSNGDTPAGHAIGFDNEVQRRKTLFRGRPGHERFGLGQSVRGAPSRVSITPKRVRAAWRMIAID